MITPLTIVTPASEREAFEAYQGAVGSAAYYAGGTELLLLMKQGVAQHDVLIDLKGIVSLSGISRAGADRVRVGSCVKHREIERSPLLGDLLPLLPTVERHVANVRVRNAGTLGGNLCFAEPHSDMTLVTLLLDGEIGVFDGKATRTIPAGEFFVGAYETAMQPGDLLCHVDFPVPPAGTVFGYQQFRLHERPSCVVGVVLQPTKDGKGCRRAAVGEGAAGLAPRRSPAAEALLENVSWEEAAGRAAEVGRVLAEEAEPLEDLTGSEEYKRHLIDVLAQRAISEALGRREANNA